MNDRLTLNLLGGFHLEDTEGTAIRLPLKRARALLAYLATETRRQHSRDELATLLWGDARQDQARHNLRQLLSSLRKVLPSSGAPLLRTEGDHVSLDRTRIDLDVLAFERLSAAEDAQSKREAISLYRGGFLVGFELETPGFNEWVHHHRERLKEVAIGCLLRLQTVQAEAERFDEAILLAQRILALDPLREDVHQFLINTYATQGKKTLALRQYKRCAELLEEELGIAPDSTTQQLYAAISRSNGAMYPAGRTFAADLRNEGISKPIHDTTDADPARRPLFGRHDELAAIRPMLQRFAGRRGGIIALVGEAGIGKSRMTAEILDRAGKDKVVWIAHGRPGERIIAQGLWSEILTDDAFMADKDGAPTDEAIYDAIRAAAQRTAERKPMLLVVEDLQWADEASLRSLAYLSNRIAPLPLLLVVTSRTEDLHRYAGARTYLEWLRLQDFAAVIEIPPLSDNEATALIEHELAAEGAPTVALDEILRVSEGNPLVAIEMLQAARAHAAAGEQKRPILPYRLTSMIAARLDGLDSTARRAIEVAAVIGRTFSFGLWHKVAQFESGESVAVLETLVAHHLLEVNGNEIRFVRERIHDVVYASLLPQRRSFLHGLAARSLQSLHEPRLEPHYHLLARHWTEAQNFAAAMACEVGAATFAAKRGRWDDARLHAERAVALAPRCEDSQTAIRGIIDAELCLVSLAQNRQAFADVTPRLASLGPLVRSLGDPLYESRFLFAEAQIFYAIGRLSAAFDAARRGLRLCAITGSKAPWGQGDQIVARMHMVARNADAALQRLTTKAASAHDDGNAADEALALGALGIFRALVGDVARAESECTKGLSIIEEVGDQRSIAACLQYRGQVRAWQGQAESAVSDFDRAIGLAEACGDLFRLYLLSGYRGFASYIAGDPKAAMRDLENALRTADRLMTKFMLAQFTGYLAEACFAAGLEDEAIRHGRRALRLATEGNQPWSRSIALRALGAVLLSSNPPDPAGAERALRSALTIQEGLELDFETTRSLRLYKTVDRSVLL